MSRQQPQNPPPTQQRTTTTKHEGTQQRPPATTGGASGGASHKPVVFVIYYSMYGHIEKMSQSIKAGLESVGCECRLYQVAETLPEEVLKKMYAKEKNKSVPIITADKLPEADGILFGMPTRFGTAPAQMKALFDACGGLWMGDKLYGKPAGVFFSTGSTAGGQETTALTCVPFFTHLGMIFVPLGYKNKSLQNLDEVHGGSPYGAGTYAGLQGERQPTPLELQLCETQGSEFGKVVKKLSGAASSYV